MKRSFAALMNDIIDYAGLFPPAKLPFEQAVSAYLDYREEKEAWMLGRFICPVGQVSGFDSFREQLSDDSSPLRLSILLTERENKTDSSFKGAKRIWAASNLLDNMSIEHSIEVVECRWPLDLREMTNMQVVLKYLDEIERSWQKHHLKNIPIFFEPERDNFWSKTVPVFLEGIAVWSEKQKNGSPIIPGFKLRCGGETVEAFPSIEEVSTAIYYCSEFNVPFKATAGLHHPVRHVNQSLQTHMHGFFNIFGAALLAFGLRLPFTEIQKIVLEEDDSLFQFEEYGFRWRDLKLATDKISSLRQGKILSFGSCSFTEPREDLQNLGLL